MATSMQQAYGLLSLYEKTYNEKYGRKPSLNRHRDKWGFNDMVEDLGYERAQEVVAYYFELKYIGHPLQDLLRNYDRFSRIMKERAEDEVQRHRIREQTRKRVEEFEKTHGND